MTRKSSSDTLKPPQPAETAGQNTTQHSHKERLLLISRISGWMRDRKEFIDEAANDIIDPNVLKGFDVLRKEGRIEVLRGLIQIFMANTPRRIAEISRAVEAGDKNRIRFEAHAQKSSSASLGATAMHRICELLETDADTLSDLELKACSSRLEHEFRRLGDILKKRSLITGSVVEE